MKKSFFKKLSFVLASAMVFSTVAPAAGAFAASKPKLNSTKEYLFLGSGNDVQYDFNVKNTKKGWKYKWTSADKAIATVDKNGVVNAKGVGTAKVSVIISDKKGEEVSELKASVIVKDNIASLKVTNTPAGDKISVNKENAFAYTYTTKGGSTTKTTSVVKWSVDKTDATISADGKFSAKKAGAYKVTATAFQSEDKYNTWLTSKAADLVLATADYTVTVPNEVKAVTSSKSNAIKVEFASAVTAVDSKDVTVTNATTGTKVYVKSVELSSDKTYATINLYDTLISGNTYKVAAKVDSTDMSGEVKYVKGTPTKIVAATTQAAPLGTSYKIAYQVLDENGIDITSDTTVSFENANVYSSSISATGEVTYNTKGAVDYVYVVYTNPKTGAQIKSDKIAITCVDNIATDVTNYTLSTATDSTVSFAAIDIKTAVDLDATGYYVRFKYKDQYGVETLAPNAATGLEFEPLDPNIFMIDKVSGRVTPFASGTGNFRIKYGNINVVKSLTVRAPQKLTSLKVKWGNTKDVSDTGSANGVTNDAWFVVEAFNQYNEEMVNVPLTYKITAGGDLLTNGGKTLPYGYVGSILSNAGTSMAATKGTDGGQVNMNIYASNDTSVMTTAIFNVTKADNTEVGTTLGFIYGGNELDINNKFDGDADTGFDTVLKVFNVNSKGQKVSVVKDAQITVTGPNGKVYTAPASYQDANNNTQYGFAFDPTNTTSGSAIVANDWSYRTGSYTAVAKKAGVQIADMAFTVKDTGVLPTVTFKDTTLVGGTLTTSTLAAKLSGIDGFTVEGFKCVPLDSSKIVSPSNTYSDWITGLSFNGNTTLYSFKIKLSRVINGQTRVYTVDLPSGLNIKTSY